MTAFFFPFFTLESFPKFDEVLTHTRHNNVAYPFFFSHTCFNLSLGVLKLVKPSGGFRSNCLFA